MTPNTNKSNDANNNLISSTLVRYIYISTGHAARTGLCPVHTYPEICENANFFFTNTASTRIQRIFQPYPEIFESALQSGNVFIRYEYVYLWTVVSANLRIRLRHFLGSSLHVEHYKQTWRTARLYLFC